VVWPFWSPLWYSYYPDYADIYQYYPAYYGYPYPDCLGENAYASAISAPPEAMAQSALYASGPDPGADAQGGPEAASAARFRTDALAAFRRGDYREAARMANHALVDAPGDPKAHELMSLVLFALKEYRGAAVEAHAAVTLGPIGDWPALYAYYNDEQVYTKQLRALEQYLSKHPTAADARFVLAYHYLMTGSEKEARDHLEKVLAETPWDKTAERLLGQTKGTKGVPAPPKPSGGS
jgi:tetratricopeptide (TPR) repeat protein